MFLSLCPFAGIETPAGNAQEITAPVRTVELIGLAGTKQNAKDTLNVENGNLQLVHGKTNAEIAAASRVPIAAAR